MHIGALGPGPGPGPKAPASPPPPVITFPISLWAVHASSNTAAKMPVRPGASILIGRFSVTRPPKVTAGDRWPLRPAGAPPRPRAGRREIVADTPPDRRAPDRRAPDVPGTRPARRAPAPPRPAPPPAAPDRSRPARRPSGRRWPAARRG